MIECSPFLAYDSFDTTVRGVMEFLQARIPMMLWMVSRVQGTQSIVLHIESTIPAGASHEIKAGTVLPWEALLCHQMFAGLGPIIAPNVNDVPAYRDAPIAKVYQIGAYVGVPLLKEDGALFGALCGVSLSPLAETVCGEKPLLEMMARVLSTVLSQAIRAEEASRDAERAHAEAMRDGPTGLYNRRAMEKLMDAEEKRCRRYGHVASVVVVDLNGLKTVNDRDGHAVGDVMIRKAADAIKAGARDTDLVGRVGGDEFVVLAIECDEHGSEPLAQRIRDNLVAAGLSAGLGVATRRPGQTLYHAMERADQLMYADKRQAKASIIVPLACERPAA